MREDISSDNQKKHEEVKRKSIDDISNENSIISIHIQEEKCKIDNNFILYYLPHFQPMEIMLLLMKILSTHLIHKYKHKRNVSTIIKYLYSYWIIYWYAHV